MILTRRMFFSLLAVGAARPTLPRPRRLGLGPAEIERHVRLHHASTMLRVHTALRRHIGVDLASGDDRTVITTRR